MARDKIKHGRSKLISNYGGVGSLIETQDCSVIIETFDNWQYKIIGSTNNCKTGFQVTSLEMIGYCSV